MTNLINLPPHNFAAAMKPAIMPVVPMPTGQAELPHTGQMLFKASAPAKIDHHPAKRIMVDDNSLVRKGVFGDGRPGATPSVLRIVFAFMLFPCYFSLGNGQAAIPPSMTFTFFQPLPSSTLAASYPRSEILQ